MSNIVKRLLMYVFLLAAAFISIFPFLWMIVSSTNRSVDVTRGKLLPGNFFIENLRNLLTTVDILTALKNSLIVSVATTLLAILIGSLAGYGFEIYRSRAKDMVFNILLSSMMIPFAALMVPLYRMFGQITNLIPAIGIDTLAAVVLPTMTTAFLIFFFRQNTKMFPRELLEAGRIDGLSELGLFVEPLYANDANDLRCCCDYHVYVQLEQLFVAVDRPANAAKPDGATACLHSGLQLCTGLRRDHAGHRRDDHPDSDRIFCDAEAFCSRNDWLGEVMDRQAKLFDFVFVSKQA